MSAIAYGEDRGVRGLQRWANSDEAVGEGEAGCRKPALRAGACGTEGEGGRKGAPIGKGDRGGAYRGGGRSGQQRYAVAGAVGQKGAPCARADMGKRRCGLFEDRHRGVRNARCAQAVGRGQRQLDPGDAAAEDDDRGLCGQGRDEDLPPGSVIAKRLGRGGVGGKAGKAGQVGGDADVD
ncbi:hypothetical protein GALL_493170 [mine drainage metagenome]|uniref:Uncharacterized protein n=1 Tax=mine drainage metagenome TaxID=410659 RepID=A0A1J5PUX6_9ZZZZ